MNKKNALLVGAAILFGLSAFNVLLGSLSLVSAGLCLVVVAQLVDSDE